VDESGMWNPRSLGMGPKLWFHEVLSNHSYRSLEDELETGNLELVKPVRRFIIITRK
jgi:hypothetical protein